MSVAHEGPPPTDPDKTTREGLDGPLFGLEVVAAKAILEVPIDTTALRDALKSSFIPQDRAANTFSYAIELFRQATAADKRLFPSTAHAAHYYYPWAALTIGYSHRTDVQGALQVLDENLEGSKHLSPIVISERIVQKEPRLETRQALLMMKMWFHEFLQGDMPLVLEELQRKAFMKARRE